MSFILVPKLSDFQVLARGSERAKSPFDILLSLLGRGEVYPRPLRPGHCSDLLIVTTQLR